MPKFKHIVGIACGLLVLNVASKLIPRETIRMKISGSCVRVKVPEQDRSSVQSYLNYRRLNVSPAFPVALGAYSTGADHSESDSLYDPNGPYRARMKLRVFHPSGKLLTSKKRWSYARLNCPVVSEFNGLLTSDESKDKNCNRGYYSINYYPADDSFDKYPTYLSCSVRQDLGTLCSMNIRVSDQWGLNTAFKREYMNNWQDIRERMINYSAKNITGCGPFRESIVDE